MDTAVKKGVDFPKEYRSLFLRLKTFYERLYWTFPARNKLRTDQTESPDQYDCFGSPWIHGGTSSEYGEVNTLWIQALISILSECFIEIYQ